MEILTIICIGVTALASAVCIGIMWREIEALKSQVASMALEVAKHKEALAALAEEAEAAGGMQEQWTEGFNNLLNYSLLDAFKAGGDK